MSGGGQPFEHTGKSAMSIQAAALREALLTLNRIRALELLQAAAATMSPLKVVEDVVRPALEQVGDLWDRGGCALSQVYMSGRICEELLDQLLGDPTRPSSSDLTPAADSPRLAIVVLEDYHLLGKQIVRTVMRSSGHSVRDYGRQTVDELVERVCSDAIDILLVSTLMLPAALRVEVLMRRLGDEAPGTRVVVGGAPYRFDDRLWREVGAHAVGLNAGEVVGIVEQLQRGVQ
jgi:methanogenic corrinoid protein MtbC1